MNTTSSLQSRVSPSSCFVKNRLHLAFSGVAHGSSVKQNSAQSASNSQSGVGHSAEAAENRTRREVVNTQPKISAFVALDRMGPSEFETEQFGLLAIHVPIDPMHCPHWFALGHSWPSHLLLGASKCSPGVAHRSLYSQATYLLETDLDLFPGSAIRCAWHTPLESG